MAHPATTKEDIQLIKDLHAISGKKKNLIKSTAYPAPADPSIKVRSWKMQEWKYYDVPSPFPTLARGIFSMEGDEDNKHRIVIRGYDKFFNIGEVPWTTWQALEAHTVPPYTLSLKSNGCIIFIGALTPDKLLITSKHAIGHGTDGKLTHAEAGERWLRKYLKVKDRTEADLAGLLWKNNWTAIAELCDDSFEEHVLPYPPEQTGLHLHGINETTKAFKTLLTHEVDAFAEEWGFIKTLTKTMDTIQEVRDFTSEIAETGFWNGVAVEGFVVRTHVGDSPPSKGNTPTSKSPYAPGSTFFFKVKFDEPYMMYRDWREVTKSLLSTKSKHPKSKLDSSNVPKKKMARPETRAYARWVIAEIERDLSAFEGYTNNHGIIATRERFLKYLETESGKKALEKAKLPVEKGRDPADAVKQKKTVIVPIAIPGCGKTAVAVALKYLFAFRHTQSDDVPAKNKKPADVFIKNVKSLLGTTDVVIADKNNHLRQHRNQLANIIPKPRLIALDWSHNLSEMPHSTVARICGDRIVARGSNHQTLRAGESSRGHENVVWMFINGTEELGDSEVDEIVEMSLTEDMESSIKRAVRAIVELVPDLDMPSEERLKEAVDVANGYTVNEEKKTDKKSDKGKKAEQAPRYFGFLPEISLFSVLEDKLFGGAPESAKKMWADMKKGNRVSTQPHITIVHGKAIAGTQDKAEKANMQALWDQCAALQSTSQPVMFRLKFGNLVWNQRVMALVVDDVSCEGEGGREFVRTLPDDVRNRLHVTVGTRRKDILPVEAMRVVESWRAGRAQKEGIESMVLEGVEAEGRVKGLFS